MWKSYRRSQEMENIERKKCNSPMPMREQRIWTRSRSFKHGSHWHRRCRIFSLKFRDAVRYFERKTCHSDQPLDPNAIISIGIASIDIDRHAGLYNNSLGYHNDTGRIHTSWRAHANTLGVQYGKGNTVGIYVTYFGKRLSTVLIYYNNFPIATR